MMKTRFDLTGSIETFDRMAMELSSDARGEGLLVLACDANGWTPEALDPLLRALPKPVFGGVFPHIIHESRNHERGTLVLGLPARPEIACIPGLGDPDADYAAALTPFAERWRRTTSGSPLQVCSSSAPDASHAASVRWRPTGSPESPGLDSDLAAWESGVMALDQVGLKIVAELEELLPAPGTPARRTEAVVRCRAIINALEVQIEEDAEPPEPAVVDHLGAAFVSQARAAGLESSRASRVIDGLVDHLRRRQTVTTKGR